MTEHPTVQDYINRAERNRDYWREETESMIWRSDEWCHARRQVLKWHERAENLRDQLTA